jgi:hypothetical protein
LEPELEEGEVKYCPDCGAIIDPCETYCPNCGVLAQVRQTQPESLLLIFSRCAVAVAGIFSLLSIIVNFMVVLESSSWVLYDKNARDILVLVFSSMSLLSIVGAFYAFESGHKRWNTQRSKLVFSSAMLMVLLGSLDVALGLVVHGIVASSSIFWPVYYTREAIAARQSIIGSIASVLLVAGAFIVPLSLPGLVVSTRGKSVEDPFVP